MIDLDAYEERAAIMEYDGGLSRFKAETLAAQAQGAQRWEVVDAIKRRDSEASRDRGKAMAGRTGADDLPGVQPNAKEETRAMPERERD